MKVKSTDDQTRRNTVDEYPRRQADQDRLSGRLKAASSELPHQVSPASSGARVKSSFAADPRMMTIIPEFVDGLPGDVRKMTEFLQSNDLAGLQRVVHQLLGACGGYGFDSVTEPAMKAEESIKAGEAPESIAAQIKSLMDLIRRIDGYEEFQASPPVAAGNGQK